MPKVSSVVSLEKSWEIETENFSKIGHFSDNLFLFTNFASKLSNFGIDWNIKTYLSVIVFVFAFPD